MAGRKKKQQRMRGSCRQLCHQQLRDNKLLVVWLSGGKIGA
jgi:hypothetical protein